MKHFLDLAWRFALCLALLFAARVLLDLHLALAGTAGQARYTMDNANRAIRELAQTSANLRHATAAWEQESKATAANSARATAELDRDLVAAHGTIVALGDTERQFSETIAALRETIRQQNETALAIEHQASGSVDQAQQDLFDLDPLLRNAAAAAGNVSRLSGDPSLPITLANIERSSDHLDATTASLDRDAQMIEARLRQALKPASLAKRIFLRALGLAGPAAQVATAAK